MKSSSRFLVLFAAIVVTASWAVPAAGQGPIEVERDTLSVMGRSSWEEGFLSLFDMDRLPVGARALGMGGAGVALQGGPESMALNPASILGMMRPQLESEAVMTGGGGTVKEFPSRLPLSSSLFLNTSDYRVSPRSGTDYRNLALGMPLMFLGRRAAMAISYRRDAAAGRSAETRAQLQSNAFQSNEPVTFGRGDNPDEGVDAISVGMAREVTGWWDLGITLNWLSGTVKRNNEEGISIFGFTILHGTESFAQDVSAFNVDLGTRARFGPLSLAGAAYLGHDETFQRGKADVHPLPGNTLATEYFLNKEIEGHTLSVPTMITVGSALQLSSRLTLAADYWIRPWSQADITRRALVPSVGFKDLSDSTTFFTKISLGDGEETFNARLDDTNSLRVGLEYQMLHSQGLRLPVRLGYRRETLTLSNVTIPPEYADYQDLIARYYHGVVSGNVDPEVERKILDYVEHKALLFRGDGVDASTYSLGLGISIDAFTAEMAVEYTSYDIQNFFLGPPDPDPRFGGFSPLATIRENRSATTLSLTTRWRF